MFATVSRNTTAAQFENIKAATGKRVVCRPTTGFKRPSILSTLVKVTAIAPVSKTVKRDYSEENKELERIVDNIFSSDSESEPFFVENSEYIPLCAEDFEHETGQPLIGSYEDIRG